MIVIRYASGMIQPTITTISKPSGSRAKYGDLHAKAVSLKLLIIFFFILEWHAQNDWKRCFMEGSESKQGTFLVKFKTEQFLRHLPLKINNVQGYSYTSMALGANRQIFPKIPQYSAITSFLALNSEKRYWLCIKMCPLLALNLSYSFSLLTLYVIGTG